VTRSRRTRREPSFWSKWGSSIVALGVIGTIVAGTYFITKAKPWATPDLPKPLPPVPPPTTPTQILTPNGTVPVRVTQ
jgi:hypothetical protein